MKSSTQLPRFAHHFEPESINVAESRDLAVVRGRFRFTADTLRPEKVQAGNSSGSGGGGRVSGSSC